jgi:hypothetical protein
MTGKYIGLKFLFANSPSFLQVAVDEDKAKEIVKGWTERDPRFLDKKVVGEHNNPWGAWAVVLDQVVAIHTFQPEQRPVPTSGFHASGMATPLRPW